MKKNILTPGPMHLDEYDKFEDFLHTLVEEGSVTRRELDVILRELVKALNDAGSTGNSDDRSFRAVLRAATHRMKRVLIELHPELAGSLRNLNSPNERF
jgi:hypothetical protein